MMQAMKLSQLNTVLAGELTADAEVHTICTDSRALKAGDCFVALSGEHFDANQFVASAAQQQAVAAIVSQRQPVDIPQLVVADTRLALGQIAAMQRQAFNKPVIALTGSAGKTTTKEMLASIMAQRGAVLATQGNLNNEIGVPLTLLQLQPQHDCAVIEMGAAKKADIAYLCQFAQPTIAIVTNALQAHLAGFGSTDVVAQTKGEIYLGLAEQDTAVINIDSEYAELWQQQAAKAQRISFSLHNSQADVFASAIKTAAQYTEFNLHACGQHCAIRLPLLGKHNVANALAAAAAALAAGASLAEIKTGLQNMHAVAGRLNVIAVNDGLTLIDDSYNANPDAVQAAIDVLAQSEQPRCLVLGAMAELGEHEQALHRQMGSYCRSKNIDHVVAVGPWANDVAAGFGEGAVAFASIEALQQAGLPYCQQGTVLVKGSRSSHMERVVEIITTTFTQGETD
ncbi:UDP-N-acetylmuramoyl-tripeptide--D-alanyl-D-alanine ligase [Dasania sp. GY-MA-18]|uniref:UDP-N-acetylmuramoyl-tripeptide--D-alanyl-D-alanine ligase n=1 Tax=Dasania phycosphaerae TaxID=2950436 RepID=A0A9J6RN23_9GAMM|nr:MULTISPECIES: UDP-N-acetylmuramoyl-tripeptide--D-alanyl-D-alanine ligase [Dasania]MCR8923692.1 UDP-N-acetylmuramoyl-tripeptide--D-alanyl-D-alanine ligase [Dasania sp. GY-MA-18]MCZ0866126.1 UDP-N-acetylmuramoyl-tripeptide--D-alanyl-D-alanine ligase [Dasania phycosphaerae]MCZ0869850.1 UDP-N-acetylmuramoyl-tripeptide--D-alanyl-D-alanine ligase [Dasania phycosphaerae]